MRNSDGVAEGLLCVLVSARAILGARSSDIGLNLRYWGFIVRYEGVMSEYCECMNGGRCTGSCRH